MAVLALSAVSCLWGLTASGYSNTYYAAAAKAGSVSWKAWFFGALDPGSFITVDKPPLSLWLMGLSARVFGFSSFSSCSRRRSARSPRRAAVRDRAARRSGRRRPARRRRARDHRRSRVAIGRVNNPDALLVLLMVGAAWAYRARRRVRPHAHLAWAGALVGLAFMTKMLQGWMIVPALAAPTCWPARRRSPCGCGSSSRRAPRWSPSRAAWPLAVTLWPGRRPFIGGSDRRLGMGPDPRLQRLRPPLRRGGGGGGGGFGGAAGLWRMFNEQVGGQVAWLLPLAGLPAAGLWLTRSAAALARAGWVLFGVGRSSTCSSSPSSRDLHPYYVSALAPAVAALCGGGLVAMVGGRAGRGRRRGARRRDRRHGRARRQPAEPHARLRPLAADHVPPAAAVRAWHHRRAPWDSPARRRRRGGARLRPRAGPATYSAATAGRSLNGNNVSAGPAGAASSMGGPGGMARGGGDKPSGFR